VTVYRGRRPRAREAGYPFSIRLTSAERDAFGKAASIAGLNTAEWIRQCCKLAADGSTEAIRKLAAPEAATVGLMRILTNLRDDLNDYFGPSQAIDSAPEEEA
jgi:hypothetical protein